MLRRCIGAVPREALRATVGGRTAQEVARDTVEIALGGLKRRAVAGNLDSDERSYLTYLRQIAEERADRRRRHARGLRGPLGPQHRAALRGIRLLAPRAQPAPGGLAYRINPTLHAVIPPPIAEIASLAAGREFPPEKPLLNLAQAVPAYPPAEALTAHLVSAVQRPEMARYTPIVGRDDLRTALAAALSETYGGRVTRDQVSITAGCNQAFCLALMALAGPGDEAILAAPSYFNYQMWLEMLGVAPVYLPFRPERGGVPDPADARARITPRTRAIVLVTPNNPTGAIYPPETIHAFHRLARESGLALVLDETYRDFLPGDGPPHGLFARTDWDGTLVHLYSFSKVYSLTGYRVGALVASATCSPRSPRPPTA